MGNRLGITFFTTCMNRLHHLKKTLPKNIESHIGIENVEFLVLDYNSSDGLESWIFNEFLEELKSGRLQYYRTNEPTYFNRSHAKNLAVKLAKGDLICNIDADNYTGKAFANFIRSIFSENFESLILPKHRNDSYGKFCCRKDHFLRVKGYDEEMNGYGYEDDDLYSRLKQQGYQEYYIEDPEFQTYIANNIAERTLNHYSAKNLKDILIATKGIMVYQIFIYSNNACELGVFKNKENLDWFPADLVDNRWVSGKWSMEDSSLHIRLESTNNAGPHIMLKRQIGNCYTSDNPRLPNVFQRISNQKMIHKCLYYRDMSENEARFNLNKKSPDKVNEKGFGKGIVACNFNSEIVLD